MIYARSLGNEGIFWSQKRRYGDWSVVSFPRSAKIKPTPFKYIFRSPTANRRTPPFLHTLFLQTLFCDEEKKWSYFRKPHLGMKNDLIFAIKKWNNLIDCFPPRTLASYLPNSLAFYRGSSRKEHKLICWSSTLIHLNHFDLAKQDLFWTYLKLLNFSLLAQYALLNSAFRTVLQLWVKNYRVIWLYTITYRLKTSGSRCMITYAANGRKEELLEAEHMRYSSFYKCISSSSQYIYP